MFTVCWSLFCSSMWHFSYPEQSLYAVLGDNRVCHQSGFPQGQVIYRSGANQWTQLLVSSVQTTWKIILSHPRGAEYQDAACPICQLKDNQQSSCLASKHRRVIWWCHPHVRVHEEGGATCVASVASWSRPPWSPACPSVLFSLRTQQSGCCVHLWLLGGVANAEILPMICDNLFNKH